MESVEVAPEADKSQPQKSSPPGDNGDGKDDAKKKPAVRKRTKTGCLTCRKRRIKCDENRPFCNNCRKSKRSCEGYNQRLVFKEPVDPYNAQYHGHAYQDHAQAILRQLTDNSNSSSSQNAHPLIAPKPPPVDQRSGQYGSGYSSQPGSATSAGFDFNRPYGSVMSQSSSHVSPATPSHPHEYTPHLADSYPGSGSSFGFFPPAPPRPVVSPAVARHEQLVAEPYDPPIDVEMNSGDEYLGDSEDEDIIEVDVRGEETYNALVEGRVVAHHEANEAVMRTFSAYAEGRALTTYMPTASNSPLNDPKTLAVFRHFVFVTGPSMSLYERHPFDHSKISPEQPIPQANHNIWTYTFPILSLSHPALLQAMLALGSLQIANLQRVPATAAMKHYHLAIRRISKNVKNEEKRKHPATLAATLLLSYYEVWSSDHTKWCRHLYGARILFREVDFKERSRQCLPAKRARRRKMENERMQQDINSFLSGYHDVETTNPDDFDDLDVETLGMIAGMKLDPEDFGVGLEMDDNHVNMPTDRDIELYEHQRDLFWWNCKMDVYQSILGGTRLFMRFKDWLACPPRAPLGRLNAIYGTFDHLLLLLGRVSEFVSDDLPRKRKANKPPGPPGSSPPMFPGMLPTQGKVTAPMGFSPPRDTSPQSESIDDRDLEAATRAAYQEWENLKNAFEQLKSCFGPEFEPLAPEFIDRRETPFGPTVQFRTFSVAGIWMNYYMGLIHLHRAHPSMPPAAMMAAGRATKDTASYAKEIGRIAAGLSDDVSVATEISTLVGAAFIESCFCLFVAGVQYQDSAQRQWLIRMLLDIARLTGWRSAKQIAEGCESYWVKAAQLGRGPPYVRSPEVTSEPQTVWSNPRRIDRRIQELDVGGVLVLAKADQANLAIGLLGVDEDLEKLNLKDD